ncbi:hypothetical protein [Caballeronia glebae]|uniref:Zinc-ribbon domain-containing protein n=1 Tax=Caballeronia glebae TaxID=1777143 RepID=A0A158CHT4_9BURK|nr:hypothetical protein [Caballeronia glebae]SAK81924.1 hypothetical protein AWB82_05430 [Caballeronia glebae]
MDQRTVSLQEPSSLLKLLHEYAAALGWKCRSSDWKSFSARYEFECQNGHRLYRAAKQIIQTHSVPQCAECEAEQVKARCLSLVAQRGGVLLGTFTGLRDRYRLRCAKGHEWETLGRNIYAGRWCHRCGRGRPTLVKSDGLEELQATAAAKGGRCLSDRYEGRNARYSFECGQGHHWEAKGGDVAAGSWCLRCAQLALGRRAAEALLHQDGLERLHEAARLHQGECLATVYTGSKDRYAFRCARGHEWTQAARHIWQGVWCKRCYVFERRISIEQMQAIAAERGGACLSTDVIHGRTKLEWKCRLGHVWLAIPDNIKKGSWCPNCAILDRTKNRSKRKRYDVDG